MPMCPLFKEICKKDGCQLWVQCEPESESNCAIPLIAESLLEGDD
jgi:hypothetical protein